MFSKTLVSLPTVENNSGIESDYDHNVEALIRGNSTLLLRQ